MTPPRIDRSYGTANNEDLKEILVNALDFILRVVRMFLKPAFNQIRNNLCVTTVVMQGVNCQKEASWGVWVSVSRRKCSLRWTPHYH
jgi:hypothetical protein